MPTELSVTRRAIITAILSVLVLLLGLSASYGLSLLRQSPELKSPTVRKYNVEVCTLVPADLREMINAFGTARAEKEVVLSAQVAGEVSEIHPQLKVGLKVRASHADSEGRITADRYDGDLLLRIDPSNYEERVTVARNRLAEDRSELARIDQEEKNLDRIYATIVADFEDSRLDYQKSLELRRNDLNTDSDLRRAKMDLRQHEKLKVQSQNERDLLPVRRELTQRRIESHAADLNLAELELARTFIRPPFDGILSAVSVERGQYVRLGEALLTITAVSEVEIPLSVTLDDYAKLLPSVLERQYPLVELAENETAATRWTGHVVRVSPKADEQTRTATVFIRVDNTVQATPLLPGTFVHARIEGPILKRVLAVPRDAIVDGRAFVERDGLVERRQVVINRYLFGLALIESGLAPGDRVVLTNLDVLYDGASVNALIDRTLAEELTRQRTRSAKLIESSTIPE